MKSRIFGEKGITVFTVVVISLVLAVVVVGCAPAPATEAPAPATEAPAPPAEEAAPPAEEAVEEAPEEMEEGATLAIEHFSIIEGTTWSGAHDRAGKRIAEK
jgi:simple sugar transport system substrate-binding protein